MPDIIMHPSGIFGGYVGSTFRFGIRPDVYAGRGSVSNRRGSIAYDRDWHNILEYWPTARAEGGNVVMIGENHRLLYLDATCLFVPAFTSLAYKCIARLNKELGHAA